MQPKIELKPYFIRSQLFRFVKVAVKEERERLKLAKWTEAEERFGEVTRLAGREAEICQPFVYVSTIVKERGWFQSSQAKDTQHQDSLKIIFLSRTLPRARSMLLSIQWQDTRMLGTACNAKSGISMFSGFT